MTVRTVLGLALSLSLAACSGPSSKGGSALGLIQRMECPARLGVGEAGAFRVRAGAEIRRARDVTWDWGDGETGTGVEASHIFQDAGVHTVTVTTGRRRDTETCRVTVAAGDAFCAYVTELNSVFFASGSTALTADARERLDENLSLFRRCPSTCVLLRGYTDEQETGQLRLSQGRADAIRDYYVSQGTDMSRLRAEGLGQAPDADSQEDPGPGDQRARRGNSLPVTCGTFTPTSAPRR